MFKVSEIELVYRSKVKASQRPSVMSSGDAHKIFMDSWNPDRIEMAEEFKALLLNRANKALGVVLISSGGVSGTVVDMRLIFSSAIKANASSIIICHNHPSGNLKPSDLDCKLTEKIKKAGKILEIEVLDHLIVTKEGFYSFADQGLI